MKSTEGEATKPKAKTAVKAKSSARKPKTAAKKSSRRKAALPTRKKVTAIEAAAAKAAAKAVTKKTTTKKKKVVATAAAGQKKKVASGSLKKKLVAGTLKKKLVSGQKKKVVVGTKKKIAGTAVGQKKKIVAAGLAQKKKTEARRSGRTKNQSFNYDETASHESSDEDNSLKESTQKTKKTSRKRKDASEDNNPTASDEQWEVYDQGASEKDDSWNEHYRRLQEFHSTHGHSGVPTDLLWEDEPDFCSWVSRQRQLFREIRTGYRIATVREEGRWRRLQVLKFPLNYEHWLWQKQYNELSQVLGGEKYTSSTVLPSPLREWVDRQTSWGFHYKGRMNAERRANLEQLGVLMKDDESDASDLDEEW